MKSKEIKRSLTCVSSNNNYIHSLQQKRNEWSIATTTYPIQKNETTETILPESISTFLSLDAPLELLLASSLSNTNSILLCIYTPKSIYVVTLDSNYDILDIEEPLELNMLRSSLQEQNVVITRVRHPSTSYHLYPNGCLLVLLSNGTLIVYHSTLKSCSIPIIGYTNDLFVDFILDGNNTVYYLTNKGGVYATAPIVIDSMMVPKWKIDACIEKCHAFMDDDDGDEYKKAQVGRVLAERRFYDVFVESGDNSEFLKCRYRAEDGDSATLWPILLQGPLVVENEGREEACFVEVLVEDENGSALGLVVAYSHGRVDIVYLSRPVEVRFGMESEEDRDVLNERILGQSAVVERVQMGSDIPCNKPIMLKVEQDGTMIHYADQSGVFTITNNVASVMQGTEEEMDTNAWPCVTLSNSTTLLTGVDIILSADLGHILISKFSNGSIDVVNLTAALYMNTYPLLSPKQTQTSTQLSSPLLEQITPLITQIQKTRSSITTLIDSSKLKPSQADASTIATLLYYRNMWEKGYILPLLQLEKLIQYRIPILTSLASRQKELLEKVSTQIKSLQESYDKSIELASTLDTNATILSNRSQALLETTKALTPNITQAEDQYFDFLTKQTQQCTLYKKQIQGIVTKLDKFKQLQSLEYCVDLSTEQKDMTNDLLSGNDVRLQSSLEDVRLVKKELEGVRRNIDLLKKQ